MNGGLEKYSGPFASELPVQCGRNQLLVLPVEFQQLPVVLSRTTPIVQYPMCLAVAQQNPNLSISCQPLNFIPVFLVKPCRFNSRNIVGTCLLHVVQLIFL